MEESESVPTAAEADMGCCSCKQEKDTSGTPAAVPNNAEETEWAKKLVDETIMASGKVDKTVILGLPKGKLLAWYPSDFTPDSQGVKDIINAFNDKTEGLAERGLCLGHGSNTSVPGKIVEEQGIKAIYGNDAHGGGCSAFKTKTAVVIVVFEKDPPPANRLGWEVAEDLLEAGR